MVSGDNEVTVKLKMDTGATTDAAVCSFWFSNYQLDSTQAIAWEPISCNIASLVELCATCTIDCQKSWNSADKYWNVKYTINQ